MHTCLVYLESNEKCLALPGEKREDQDHATAQGI